MYKLVEPDRRILFMDVSAQVVIGFDNFCGKSDRTFDFHLEDLATNEELLSTLNLVSMYADKGNAIPFFKHYLSAFYNDEGVLEKLDTNPIIRILIQDVEKLKKVRELSMKL